MTVDLSPDTIITIDDAIAVGLCPSGQRRWMRARGIDFRIVVKNGGIRLGDLPQDDAFIRRIVARKLERSNA